MKIKDKITPLFLVLIAFACGEQEQQQQNEIAVPVSITEVEKGNIEKYISTTGTVYPTEEVELKAEISGTYNLRKNPRTRRPYALGDQVNKGDLLITIEDSEYRNNINLESKRLNLNISKATLEKQKSLLEKGGASELDVQNAEVEYVNAKNAYEAAQIQLSKMRVTSPFSGTIVDLPHTTGGINIESGSSLVKLMNYRKLRLEVNFPEKHLSTIKEGMKMRVTNYTLPDDTIFGEITALSPAIDAETRTFKSALELSNPDKSFRPGMFVKADLVVASKDSVIVIPKDVILSRQKGNTVFVVERGEARERIIEIGLENPETVEVIKGLELNDRLVTEGFETLTNRSKVTVVK